MRGQRKPTALKILHGEKNKDRIRKDEPKPRPISPQPPAGLEANAKRVWRRLAKALERNGLLTEVDGEAFAALCELEALHYHLRKSMKDCQYKMLAEKHTVDGAGNEHLEVKTNPLVVQILKVIAQKRPYYAEFGMTPASRTKISVPGVKEDGEFESLLD